MILLSIEWDFHVTKIWTNFYLKLIDNCVRIILIPVWFVIITLCANIIKGRVYCFSACLLFHHSVLCLSIIKLCFFSITCILLSSFNNVWNLKILKWIFFWNPAPFWFQNLYDLYCIFSVMNSSHSFQEIRIKMHTKVDLWFKRKASFQNSSAFQNGRLLTNIVAAILKIWSYDQISKVLINHIAADFTTTF